MMEVIVTFIFILILWVSFSSSKKYKKSHIWRRKSADKTLKKIKSFKFPGQIFSYLRKVDPFVVEEIILNSIEHRQDIEVIRNDKYTGDGGIDGRFNLTVRVDAKEVQRLYLIQVKRYNSYINVKDLNKFNKQIVEENAYAGLFVHTGKSGKAVYKELTTSGKIKLVSGKRLIDLLINGRF